MPRKKESLDFASLKLNRTVGLEIEGYMRTSPRYISEIPFCEVRTDGSLRNSDWWRQSNSYGVEVVTKPLDRLDVLPIIFESIVDKGWSASGNGSLHIHVDASDFTFYDKLKAAHFLKKIEDVIFLFVKNRRYNNRFCAKIPQVFTTVLADNRLNTAINFNDFLRKVSMYRSTDYHSADTNRYRWANIFRSHYNTIEFRLFHPIRKAEDGAMYAYLVQNLVNVIKNSTIEQLEFISESIIAESKIENKAKMFLEALSIPYKLPIINDRATEALIRAEQIKATNELILAQ